MVSGVVGTKQMPIFDGKLVASQLVLLENSAWHM